MLHLVWTKDNSTVVVADENGTELKGIRSKVIECYKELFLTRLPNSTDKQHIGRVSKNLIESVSSIQDSSEAMLMLSPRPALTQAHVRLHARGAHVS